VNTLVIYHSQFGNTRRIAEAIAEVLAQAGPAQAISIAQCSADEVAEADLVLVGSPTHYQAVPKAVRGFLKDLPRRSMRNKYIAAFDTSLKMWGPIMLLTAAHGVMAQLRRLGGKRLDRPQTFLVQSGDLPAEGEVDMIVEGEMDRAQAWALNLLRTVESRGR